LTGLNVRLALAVATVGRGLAGLEAEPRMELACG
jgi:hypothetical protein